MISKKHKKVCTILNHTEPFLILAFAITGWLWISAFASLIGIYIEITSSVIGLTICAITTGIKVWIIKIIIQKKKKKHDKIVLLAKSELNSIKVLFFKVLIDSIISYD